MTYSKERMQFGKPIGAYQGIHFQLAEMATDIEAARLMTLNVARMYDAGDVDQDGSVHGQVLRCRSQFARVQQGH